MIDLAQSLQTAKSAALLAGEFLLKSQGSDLNVLLNEIGRASCRERV